MEGFAIVEQMGHRRVVGRVAEVEVCGQRMMQVSTLSEPPIVTLVHPQSLYAVTACTEAQARRAAGDDYSPLRELDAPSEADPPEWGARADAAQLERDHARLVNAGEALWGHYRDGYDALDPTLRALVGELSAALCEGGGDAPDEETAAP